MRRTLRPRRGARLITAKGITDTITGWAIRLGIGRERIVARLAQGWSEEETLTTPFVRRQSKYRWRAD